jgi:hypothetical protein
MPSCNRATQSRQLIHWRSTMLTCICTSYTPPVIGLEVVRSSESCLSSKTPQGYLQSWIRLCCIETRIRINMHGDASDPARRNTVICLRQSFSSCFSELLIVYASCLCLRSSTRRDGSWLWSLWRPMQREPIWDIGDFEPFLVHPAQDGPRYCIYTRSWLAVRISGTKRWAIDMVSRWLGVAARKTRRGSSVRPACPLLTVPNNRRHRPSRP